MTTTCMPDGWAAVERKARQIDEVRPERLHAAAERFRTTAARVGDHAARLRAAAEPLRCGTWAGHTADAFHGYVDQLHRAGTHLGDRLGATAGELSSLHNQLTGLRSTIGERVQTARREIEKVNADAVAAAAKAQAQQQAAHRRVLGAAPAKTPEAILADAADRNAATAGAAGEDVDGLLGKASGMIGRCRQLMDEGIAGAYSAMRPRADAAQPPIGAAHPATQLADAATRPARLHAQPAQHTHPAHPRTTHTTRHQAQPAQHTQPAQQTEPAQPRTSPAVHAQPATTFPTHPGLTGAPPSTMPPGDVDQWIQEAIKDLQAAGIPVTNADIHDIWAIIQHESGGNPNAINNWDSNAAAGHPSMGLMQCIDSTFQAHKLPGHDNIYNPVDNIIAGVRYAIDRYGSMSNVPGIAAMSHGGAYRGY